MPAQPSRRLGAASVLAALLAALLSVSACSGGSSVNTGGGGSAAGGGSGNLVAAISAEPDQLDPQKTTSHASFEVLENVFDTLVEPDASLAMQPALASSWTTAPDQLSWTFTLAKGVTFQNGDPFSSADVVYSYQRIITGKLANSYRFDSVKDVVAVDPGTVRIDLTRPTPNLLEDIGSFKGMAIVDKKNVDSGQLGTHPVGTGPFAFGSWNHGDSITLTRNPTYFRGAPKLASVKFTFVSEPTTALADLQGSQVQWTDNLPTSQVSSLQKSSSPVVKTVPSNDYWYLALNEAKAPYNDPRVRQAFAYAIDRNAVTQAAKYGQAAVNQTAIPKGSYFYDSYSPYTTDVAKAKQLLSQAGVQNLSVDMMVTSQYPETVQAAQVMKDELSKVGVTMNIRTEDFATWLADEGKGAFDAFMLGWLGNIDPDDFYYDQHHTGAANNFQKYSNPAVDSLLDRARATTDKAQRKGLYDQAVKMIVDDASYIYLYNPDVVQGWSSSLKNYTERADQAIRFRDASLS
jgi:peptide/nickel transport system substrate-binding protein